MPERRRRRAHQLAHRRHRRRAEFGASPTAIREHLEIARHRGPPGVEAHAPPAGVRRLPDARRRVAEEIFRTGLCLPSGSAMTDADVDRVVEGVLASVGRAPA